MKATITVCSAVVLLFATDITTVAGVVAGPITNPANGHDYYLLSPNTWTASEAEAENLNGTLAIIKNAAEQHWVFSTFGSYGGTHRNLWIGLHRQQEGGPLVWVDGQKSDYANWCPHQPDDFGGKEDSVEMLETSNPWGATPAVWNDCTDDGSSGRGPQPCGVVEVPHEKSLTKDEKSLIGAWYEGGRIDRPCYIAGTANMLFAIGNYGCSARVIYASASHIFAASWHARGQISQDNILWSDGTWWSRKVSNYSVPTMPRGSTETWPTPIWPQP